DRLRARGVLEADLVAHEAPRRSGHLLGEPVREAACRDAPGLRAADEPRRAAPAREADLRDLRGLPRAGLAAHDGDRMRAHELPDPLAMLRDRKLLGKRER